MGKARVGSAGRATTAQPQGTVEQLRSLNEALLAENARLRLAAGEREGQLASFPLMNPNPVLEVAADGSVRFCNPAARAVLESLGLDPESPGPFLPPDVGAVAAGSRPGGNASACHEVTLRGRTFAEHLYVAPSGGAVRVYAYEITAKTRAERELAAALQRLDAHMDNSPVAVVEFDPQFRVIRWSKEAERVFGWQPAEILGRSISEMRWVHEGDAEAVRRESAEFLCGDKTRSVHVNRNLRKDGSSVDCEWYNSAIYDESGRLTSVLSIVLDVTGRRQGELALRASVGRLELLAATAGELLQAPEPQRVVDALCTRVLEFLGCHVFFNYLVDERAGGLRLNACAGIPAEEEARIGSLDFGVAVCGCVASDGRRIVAEHVQTTPDERLALVRGYGVRAYACHPLLGPGGAVLGTLSFGSRDRDRFEAEELSLMKTVADLVATAMIRVRDTRALRESKDLVERNLAELGAVNAELEAFVYSVSHDLREPVRAVSAFARMVLAQSAGGLDARGADYLGRVERAAARMSRLIEDLLDLSRVSRQSVERAEVDLSAIAAATLADLQEADPGRRVDVEIAPGLTGLADRRLIGIVLSNLLANAWKFTSATAAARVSFGRAPQAGEPVYFVADNGVGFDPAYAPQLFQPFHRLHAERDYPGTGIGLALVARVVNRHGGRVWAEGRPGAGATFFFTLGGPGAVAR